MSTKFLLRTIFDEIRGLGDNLGMIKVFLIHGFEGSPNGGWRSWLMEELRKRGIYACSLPMPNPKSPILSEWLDEINRQISNNDNDVIYLVGHSLGGTVILRYIEKYESKNIDIAIFVSTPCEKTENRKIDSFLENDFNYESIKERIENIVVIHGDDDPWVPLSNAKKIAEKTDGKLILIHKGKHLNDSAGFTELPECLDELLKTIEKSSLIGSDIN